MKAIVYRHYGSPDVLACEEIDQPIAADGEVLIRVCAAALNPLDWHFMGRAVYPFASTRGCAGQRPDSGSGLTWRAGWKRSAGTSRSSNPVTRCSVSAKERVPSTACTSESALVMKPDRVTFEQAAAAPVAGITALQGLRDKGQLQPGQSVLINGAAGGVGTFAVQVARSFGARVTGVCSTRNVHMVRSLGADQVIDYVHEDFTKSAERYDLMFDCVGNHSLFECRRVLTPRGRYIVVGGPDGRWIGPLARVIKALVLSPVREPEPGHVACQAPPGGPDHRARPDGRGNRHAVIDRLYTLSEVPDAIRYLEEGHARGKVVITLAQETQSRDPASRS